MQMRIIFCQMTRLVQLKVELTNTILTLGLKIIIWKEYEIQVNHMMAGANFQNYNIKTVTTLGMKNGKLHETCQVK
jgi:hypothetical protein